MGIDLNNILTYCESFGTILPANFYNKRQYCCTVKVSLVPTKIGRCMGPINNKPTHFLFQNSELSRAISYRPEKSNIAHRSSSFHLYTRYIEIVISYICQVSVISRVPRSTLDHIVLLYHIISTVYIISNNV